MPDKALINQAIDGLDMRPLTDTQRHRAALNVCTTMHLAGCSSEEIRTVLGALHLLNSRSAPAL
jgi:hypothetical protein